MLAHVRGLCPACGQHRLHIEVGAGLVHCLNPQCPRPGAAHEILSDPITDHLVVFEGSHWTLKHPLIERLDNQLLSCWVADNISALLEARPSDDDGVYRVRVNEVDGIRGVELVGLP